MVIALEYATPESIQRRISEMKTHPTRRQNARGWQDGALWRKVPSYGGWYAMPKEYLDGGLISGGLRKLSRFQTSQRAFTWHMKRG